MLAKQIRQYIIRPTLQATGLWSEEAELLVYGTGWVETAYEYVVQMGNPKNGGLGFFQDEPTDYRDIVVWLKNGFNKGMIDKVLTSCAMTSLPDDPTILMSNIKLALLFCRIHYHRIREPLPALKDAKGMAEYHFKHYNSGGKADVVKNTTIFTRIINEEL